MLSDRALQTLVIAAYTLSQRRITKGQDLRSAQSSCSGLDHCETGHAARHSQGGEDVCSPESIAIGRAVDHRPGSMGVNEPTERVGPAGHGDVDQRALLRFVLCQELYQVTGALVGRGDSQFGGKAELSQRSLDLAGVF